MRRRRTVAALLALASLASLAAGQGVPTRFDPLGRLGVVTEKDMNFRITFLTGTFPETIVLGSAYAGPVAGKAFYDAGDGEVTAYSSNTITLKGSYIKFTGDWRDSTGGYRSFLHTSLQSTAYTCRFSGTLPEALHVASAYQEIFRDATAVTSFDDPPWPPWVGSPAANMFYRTFYGLSSLANIPAGTLNTSGLTGSPAVSMFYRTFCGMSSLTNIPAGTLDTSGLTGAPAVNMFSSALGGLSSLANIPAGTLDTSGLTGAPAANMFFGTFDNVSSLANIPAGTLNTSGLTGSPAGNMFYRTFYGMSALKTGTLTLGAGITFDSTNVVTSCQLMFAYSSKWEGQLLWGTNVLTTAIPVPNAVAASFRGCTAMPGYADIHANWK